MNIKKEKDIQQGLINVIKDGVASQIMATLTGGVFLVAFALQLGASNMTIGLLAAISPLTQFIQIPSVYLIQKIGKRKITCIYATAAGRFFLLLIALLPFIPSTQSKINLLVTALFLHSLLGAVGGASWNSWMRDLIPQEKMGSFFARRMMLATAGGMIVSFAAGAYIDIWKKLLPDYQIAGYSILFMAGFGAGILGIHFIRGIPEPGKREGEERDFLKTLFQPLKDLNFRNLIVFSTIWSFALNMAAPFFTVYMVKRLELGVSLIVALGALSQIISLMFLNIWGKISDRFSNKSILQICVPAFLVCTLAWTFTTLPEKHFFTFPLLVIIHIFMGISVAGINLASGNIGLKLSPKGQATSYLAVRNVTTSITASIAPILGGKLIDFFANRQLSLILRWTGPQEEFIFYTLHFQYWDFFFFFAFLIGIYSLNWLNKVKEAGEVKEKIVLSHLLAETRGVLRNLSTIGGLRQLFQLSFLTFHLGAENDKEK